MEMNMNLAESESFSLFFMRRIGKGKQFLDKRFIAVYTPVR